MKSIVFKLVKIFSHTGGAYKQGSTFGSHYPSRIEINLVVICIWCNIVITALLENCGAVFCEVCQRCSDITCVGIDFLTVAQVQHFQMFGMQN